MRQERFKRECSFDIRSETKIISTQKQFESVSIEENSEEEEDRHNSERRFPWRIDYSDFIDSRRTIGLEWSKLRKWS